MRSDDVPENEKAIEEENIASAEPAEESAAESADESEEKAPV